MADLRREKKVCLGAEHDEALRARLTAVMSALGGRTTHRSIGVGGSQELVALEMQIEGERMIVEAETYIGLSLRGRADLVDRIVNLLNR